VPGLYDFPELPLACQRFSVDLNLSAANGGDVSTGRARVTVPSAVQSGFISFDTDGSIVPEFGGFPANTLSLAWYNGVGGFIDSVIDRSPAQLDVETPAPGSYIIECTGPGISTRNASLFYKEPLTCRVNLLSCLSDQVRATDIEGHMRSAHGYTGHSGCA
jgi:hypothetical protein